MQDRKTGCAPRKNRHDEGRDAQPIAEGGNNRMDLTPTAPLLISTAPTRPADRSVAILIMLVSALCFLVAVPFAARPWPRMVAFVQSDDTGLALVNVITATLLIGQFVQLRAGSLLVLACGYTIAGMLSVAHLLASADILRANLPRLANGETTTWLFVLWHCLFPLSIMLYAILSGSGRDRTVAAKRVLPAVGYSMLAAAIVVLVCLAIAILAPPFQRDPIQGNLIAAGTAWFVTATCLGVLYGKTRARRVLDMWLCVVLFAWVLDISLGGLIGRHEQEMGWYAGRIYGLLASSLVLAAMLLETGTLYARLMTAMGGMRAQADALSKSEAALRQAQKMEAIGQITGGVAHDFNNLLTVIIGSLELLRHNKDADERTLRLTAYAAEAAAKGEQLTKQLLAFSRRGMVDPAIRHPNRLIRDFEPLVGRALGGAIEIVLDLGEPISLVRVDPAQFEAAILNLAVNARDAMDGAGTITIATRAVTIDAACAADNPEAVPGEYAMIALSDTGSGMDGETISRAFEPFFTTKTAEKGSGLGLAQVYGFVKSSEGFVTIESKPGAGATVKLFLPRHEGEETEIDSPSATAPAWRAAGEAILVVEDDPAVLDIVVETLSEFGYATVTAGTAADALEQLKRHSDIALLFSDIVMPGGMNGAQLAEAARAMRPTLPILLTTGYAAAALGSDYIVPAGTNILTKPYLPDELGQRIDELLKPAKATA
jgi:signal transduction histidine kinase/CheY-like chemotaxis protein